MKKNINEVIEQKCNFIRENAHILINILNNRMSSNNTVLETITSLIISDKPLGECEDIRELEMIIELNETLYKERKLKNEDDSDSYDIIFSIANYINSTVFDQETNNSLRDRLRLYTVQFNNDRIYSYNYNKFVGIKVDKDSPVIKKYN